MCNIDALTLLSGIDIPISEIQVNIHQPTIREIAYIGERNFYQAASLLTIDKENLLLQPDLTDEDKLSLSDQSNFQILMSMVGSSQIQRLDLQILLTLLFPEHMIEIEERFIMLIGTKVPQKTCIIDENNFHLLQDIVRVILCLNSSSEEEFNPEGERAREIAEKIKRGRAKVAKLKGESGKMESVLPRFVSSLAIGTNALTMKEVLDLTLYQLFDQLERYSLFNSFNISIQAKMAGAKDVEDVDWLKNIH